MEGEEAGFALDPRIAASSHLLARLPLCDARLQDDARFAWIVLVPRRAALIELTDLAEPDRLQLAVETGWAGAMVRAIGAALQRPTLKLNHGQLGNIVAQLHLHVVGRRLDDAAWPAPVWGNGTAKPYLAADLALARESMRLVPIP